MNGSPVTGWGKATTECLTIDGYDAARHRLASPSVHMTNMVWNSIRKVNERLQPLRFRRRLALDIHPVVRTGENRTRRNK
ncbi:MAG: hypothetical protein ACJAZO_004651 [Myxococcota bacterium]|jgi:hypothetical protein